MSRTKGAKNIQPSKAELTNQLEQKGMPPLLGSMDSFIIGPKTISNNPIDLVKLNTAFVGICNQKNATSIASTPLRLYTIKSSKSEKIVYPYKSLNKVEIDNIKRESKSLIVKQASDIVEITEHPVYDLLNNVNDDLDYYDLMELTSQYLGLIGNSYWYIEKDNSGMPVNIEVLPAEFTNVLLDSESKISGYRVWSGLYDKNYKLENIIHFKNISAGSFWRGSNNVLKTGLYGMGDVEYVLAEVYLYNAINDYLRALTENNAIPSAIVKYLGGRLDKNTMADTQKQWDKVLRTWKRAGKTKVMDQDFEFMPISLPPKDLDFAEGRKWLRGVIANAFGVPEDLLTTSDSNRASSNVAISSYFRFTIVPKLKRIEEKLNFHLITLYDDNLFFKFDNPTPNDRALDMKQEEIDLKNGVITINEVRDKRGLSPVEWGNLPMPVKSSPAVEEVNINEEGLDK